MWWTQGSAEAEDISFKKIVAEYAAAGPAQSEMTQTGYIATSGGWRAGGSFTPLDGPVYAPNSN